MRDDQEGVAGKRGSYHHGDLRRNLLRVAREEVARHGAKEVSLSSLARLAGVSQPAPYRHFANREALLEALAVEAFEELSRILHEAVASRDPRDAHEALALAYVGFGECNIEIYRLMFASGLAPRSETGSELDVAANRALDLLRATMWAARGCTDPADLEREVYRSWAQLHGIVMLKADGFIARPLAYYVAPQPTLSAGRQARSRVQGMARPPQP